MIHFEQVTLRYDTGISLRNLTFSIAEKEFVYLYGPSGSGKSSILKLMYMDLFPNAGTISVLGQDSSTAGRKDVARIRKRIGMVFQDFKLLADRDVFSNIALPLEIMGTSLAQVRQRVSVVADEFGLRSRLGHFPHELSGGEQQRVSLARAVITDPDILIADEPTAHLDDPLSFEIINWFWQQNRRGTTVIFATHKDKFIEREPSRTLTLAAGEIIEDLAG